MGYVVLFLFIVFALYCAGRGKNMARQDDDIPYHHLSLRSGESLDKDGKTEWQ